MADVPSIFSPFQLWSSPSATAPTWVTPISQTASGYDTVQWVSPTQTASGFAGVFDGWDATTGYTYTTITQQLMHQQQMTAQQAAYHHALQQHYLAEAAQGHLTQIFPQGRLGLAAPALLTHQTQARIDQALYRRALAECNEQEAGRVLRLIERREQDEAARRAAVEAQQQRAREDQQQRDAAQTRARELLLEHLTPDQRDTFVKHGWFIVEGGKSRARYRVRSDRGLVANVDVIDPRDRPTHRLCAHARSGSVPMGDQLLAQKIMLELAEDDFLRIANRHAA